MSADGHLFYVEPTRPTAEGLSVGRKITLRNNAMLEQGVHPVSRRLLANNGRTCGTCSHHTVNVRTKTYHKCDLNLTGGPGTDIRLSWPACTAWMPETAVGPS